LVLLTRTQVSPPPDIAVTVVLAAVTLSAETNASNSWLPELMENAGVVTARCILILENGLIDSDGSLVLISVHGRGSALSHETSARREYVGGAINTASSYKD
jgi:hypothetical protein